MLSLFSVLLLNLSLSSASTSSVRQIAVDLAGVSAHDLVIYDLKGETVAELVRSYAEQSSGSEKEDADFYFNYKYVEFEDEVVYGTTDSNTFQQILFSAIHFMDNNANVGKEVYDSAKLSKITSSLKDLESLSVIYSWNPLGDNVCASFFTTPVLIDSENKKAYELNFYDLTGGCQSKK